MTSSSGRRRASSSGNNEVSSVRSDMLRPSNGFFPIERDRVTTRFVVLPTALLNSSTVFSSDGVRYNFTPALPCKARLVFSPYISSKAGIVCVTIAKCPRYDRNVSMLSVTIGILPSRLNSSSIIMTGHGSSAPGSLSCMDEIRSEKNNRINGASGFTMLGETTRKTENGFFRIVRKSKSEIAGLLH